MLAAVGPTQMSAQEAPGRWTFTSVPLANLWFHGMALVDPVGPGPIPLYDPGYPNEVRRAKEQAESGPSLLDRGLGRYREEFRGDPAFEVLHFLPLYFAQAGRTEVFAALELLAMTPEGIPPAPSARTAFGLTAVGSVLTTPGQRAILGDFAEALQSEWDGFFEAWWQENAANRSRLEGSLQSVWRETYEAALAPYLTGISMTGGMVVMAPSIGTEGRIFAGVPQSASDNVLVVAAPKAPERASEAVFSMLRELSFPLARRAMEKAGAPAANRAEAEDLTGRAAVRAGALLLELLFPEEVEAYRGFFLARSGRPAVEAATQRIAFEATFPLSAEVEKALQQEILSTVKTKDGGEG
jgi:hypothetical protein